MVRAGVQVRAVVRVVRPLDRTNYSVQRAIPLHSDTSVPNNKNQQAYLVIPVRVPT